MRAVEIVLLLSGLLMGCAHSLEEMKNTENFEGTVEVDQNYQEVYRTLLTISRRCLEFPILTSEVIIGGELYNDIQEATIHQKLIGGGVLVSTGAIDIKATGEKTSMVSVYGEKHPWWGAGMTPPAMYDVVRWLNGDLRCTAPQK